MLRYSADRDAETNNGDILELFQKYNRFVFAKTKEYTSDLSFREDIAQETWICLLRLAGKLKDMSPKARATYIALTVKSSALHYLAKIEPNMVLVPEPEESDGEDEYPSAEDTFFLEHAVGNYGLWDALPEKDQQLLIGRYILGLTDAELAKRCGVKPSSVRMLLTRARRHAKEFILAEMEDQDEPR